MIITLKKQIKTNDKPWSPVKLICIRLKLKEKLDFKKKHCVSEQWHVSLWGDEH